MISPLFAALEINAQVTRRGTDTPGLEARVRELDAALSQQHLAFNADLASRRLRPDERIRSIDPRRSCIGFHASPCCFQHVGA